MSAEHAKTAEHELQRWRSWAQFVYLGGGPVTLSDDELRAAVCAAHDKQVQEARVPPPPSLSPNGTPASDAVGQPSSDTSGAPTREG